MSTQRSPVARPMLARAARRHAAAKRLAEIWREREAILRAFPNLQREAKAKLGPGASFSCGEGAAKQASDSPRLVRASELSPRQRRGMV